MRYLLFLFIFSGVLSSCGNDNVNNPCPNGKLPLSDTIFSYNDEYYDNPSNFFIYAKSTVSLAKGTFGAFDVQGQQNILNRFRTFQKGDTFNLDYDDCIFKFKPLDVTVFGTAINQVNIHDSSICNFSPDFTQEGLKLNLYDRVSGKIDGQFGVLNIENNSQNPISIEGTHGSLLLSHLGNDDVNALEANIKTANIKSYSKFDVYVSAVETLYVTINDVGNVYYEGDPVLDVKSSGTGQAIKL